MSLHTQICLFSATIPDNVLEITNKFMNNPEKILEQKKLIPSSLG